MIIGHANGRRYLDCGERPTRFAPEGLVSFLDRELCVAPAETAGKPQSKKARSADV